MSQQSTGTSNQQTSNQRNTGTSKLVHSFDLRVPIEVVWDWFCHMDTNFVRWNPDHVWFDDGGQGLCLGATVCYCRRIGSKLYDVEGTITKLECNPRAFRIEVSSDRGLEQSNVLCYATSINSCNVTFAEDFVPSHKTPGCILNFMLFDLLPITRKAERELLHSMRRDAAYLTCILEENLWPNAEDNREAWMGAGAGSSTDADAETGIDVEASIPTEVLPKAPHRGAIVPRNAARSNVVKHNILTYTALHAMVLSVCTVCVLGATFFWAERFVKQAITGKWGSKRSRKKAALGLITSALIRDALHQQDALRQLPSDALHQPDALRQPSSDQN